MSAQPNNLHKCDEPLSAEVLAHANINPKTYLATDYLNHFNEPLMLLEILPMDESVMADLDLWQPCSYKQHFANSNFKGKDVAIRAYDEAPIDVRKTFENAVAELDVTLLQVLSDVHQTPFENIEPIINESLPLLREEISALMAIISGDTEHNKATFEEEAQAEIDALFN